MLATALLLALLLTDAGIDAGTPDAGPFSATIYGSCPVAEAPALIVSYTLDGGANWLLPHPRGPRQACLLAACEEDRSRKEARFDDPATFNVAFAAGAAAGIATVMSIVLVRELVK